MSMFSDYPKAPILHIQYVTFNISSIMRVFSTNHKERCTLYTMKLLQCKRWVKMYPGVMSITL